MPIIIKSVFFLYVISPQAFDIDIFAIRHLHH